MKKLITTDLQGIDAWTALFDANETVCAFADADIQIQLFADGDTTWMLLSRYTSDTSSTDYTFMPTNDDDLQSAKLHVFDFLRTVDYSLPQLLAWLENAPFVETDIAEEITVGKIRITRNHARATKPS
jgi:hypothetical protein